MNKTADARYPIHELIRKRWSPRSFSDRPVEPDKLLQLLEAARWAPSCFNEQPWAFIVSGRDDPETYGRLLACLTERNRSWAGRAPVLMLSVAKLHFEQDGKPNRFALHDVGLAIGNLVLQATAMDLFVHQMAGFSIDRARASFGIPESHEPVAMIALGYRGDPADLPEAFREREVAPRVRNPLHSFVFGGLWNRTASWVAGSGAAKRDPHAPGGPSH
jgi:nitroreductase